MRKSYFWQSVATLFVCFSLHAQEPGILSEAQRPGAKHQSLPRPFVKMVLDNDLYYYSTGIFYRHINGYYVVVEAPLRAKITDLPSGFARVLVDGVNFSFFQGTWFIWRPQLQVYEVVPNPTHQAISRSQSTMLDASQANWVELMPSNAKVIEIGGKRYLKHSGLYYEPTIANGEIIYVVVRP